MKYHTRVLDARDVLDVAFWVAVLIGILLIVTGCSGVRPTQAQLLQMDKLQQEQIGLDSDCQGGDMAACRESMKHAYLAMLWLKDVDMNADHEVTRIQNGQTIVRVMHAKDPNDDYLKWASSGATGIVDSWWRRCHVLPGKGGAK